MSNIIRNANWCAVSSQCGPKFFSGSGPVTFDDFCHCGNRTCSVTLPCNQETTASDRYDVAVEAFSHSVLRWGYTIRAVQVGCVVLKAEFYDENETLIKSCGVDISDKICGNFQQIMACYDVPYNACYVKLSMEFSGTITACTFCAPCAYFIE